MESKELTTINISIAHKKELKKMADGRKMTQMGFLHDTIHYLKTTGINPSIIEPFSPKDEIKKLEKKMDNAIAFFQKHEQKLKPPIDEMTILNSRLTKMIGSIITREDLKELNLKMTELKKSLHEIRIEISEIKTNQKSLQTILNNLINMNSQIEALMKSNFEYSNRLVNGSNLKTQKMIAVFFEAMANKGLSGFKQEDIDKFKSI